MTNHFHGPRGAVLYDFPVHASLDCKIKKKEKEKKKRRKKKPCDYPRTKQNFHWDFSEGNVQFKNQKVYEQKEFE